MKPVPKILYVCSVCWQHASEACGRADPDELRLLPNGEQICDDCFDSDGWEGKPDVAWINLPHIAALRARSDG